MKTWREIAESAQCLLGISGITAPINSSDMTKMLNLLRGIIFNLEAKGIELGAMVSSSPDRVTEVIEITDTLGLDNQSNIPEQYLLAIECRLAIYSAPIFQISPTMELKDLAKESYDNLFSVVPPTKLQNPFQPTGQGDRYYNDRPKFMVFGYRNNLADHRR